MFPILPILILLLLGPANAERLASEGRLHPALLAVHRTMVAPVRAVVVAAVEETPTRASATRKPDAPARVRRTVFGNALAYAAVAPLLPACPPRAGPQVA